MSTTVSRRRFLQGMGALVVSFRLGAVTNARASATPEMPINPMFSVDDQLGLTPDVDGWLRIAEDDTVTIFTGRVEIGTGILTALVQIAAEELDVPAANVTIIAGDTDVVPNQGVTSATTTIGLAALPIRQAAATARREALELAADQLGVDASDLAIDEGAIHVQGDPSRATSYGAVIGGQHVARTVDMSAPTKAPDRYTIVGQSLPRIDIPAKLTAGDGDFAENARVDGMVHARILRAPAYGARLVSWDETVAELPGVLKVMPISHPGDSRLARVELLETMPGDFIAVVAERQDQAMRAVEHLAETAEWEGGQQLPLTHEELYDWLEEGGTPIDLGANQEPGANTASFDDQYSAFQDQLADAASSHAAVYRGPYHAHGPISPSWSLADVREDHATIWAATQWPHSVRWMVAQALGFESNEQVRVIAGASSGLYGRRDRYSQEVDVEAAILSQELGRPVRLQWSRHDEFVWSQYRPPQIVELTAALDDTNHVQGLHGIVRTTVTGEHPGRFLATMGLDATPYTFGPTPLEAYDAGPLLRTGYVRNVFAGYNFFALESFMDEVAAMSGEDPLDFRLRHLEDERAREVLTTLRDQVGWAPSGGDGPTGMGVAFALYSSAGSPSSAYVAHIAEVEVDEETGDVRVIRVTGAIDAGLVVNPDGLRNQAEGGIIQAISWAMKEAVTFNHDIVTSHDWATYPILTFPEVPDIEMILIDRPDHPAAGVGEPVTVTVAPAIANAIYDATGARARQLPLTPERIQAALADR